MSNAKVLNFSSSSSRATTFKLSAESKSLKMSSQAKQTSLSSATPRLTRKTNAGSGTSTNARNLSPLRSPQLIRTKNWINSNKISSGSSSTCSDESIIPKYEQQQQSASTTTSSYVNTSQKRAYNFNKVTTTKKLLNSARNTAIVYEKVSATASASSSANNNKQTNNNNEKFLSRTCEANKSFKSNSNRIVPNKMFKPTVPSNTSSISSSSSSTTSSLKSFSSKYPNGLPFEDEFYHYRQTTTTTSKNNINNNKNAENLSSLRKINRHNIRISRSVGSVASDKSSSSLSNNSQNDYFNETDHHHNLHNDHLRSSPAYMTYDDSDVMYVDFSLKSVDKLKQIASQQRNCLKKPTLSAVKTTYYINDKNDNCFCEFESIKSTSGALNKLIEGKQDNEDYTRGDKRQKDSVVYVTWSW